MRKINKGDYIDFRFEESGFSVTSTDFGMITGLFAERTHGTIYGRKNNGDIAIIDQK